MRKEWSAVCLLCAIGCANGYRSSYVSGAVIKEFTTEAYLAYSAQLNQRIEVCCEGGVCTAGSENIISKEDFDACMGPSFSIEAHEDIEYLVKVYHETASAHTAIMSIPGSDPEMMTESAAELFDSAVELLRLIPGGDKKVESLEKILGRKKP